MLRRGPALLSSSRVISAVALAAALGCSGEEDRWVRSPLPSDARAAILAVTSEDVLTVEAYDLESSEVLRPRGTLGSDATLELLAYDRTLPELGLEPGILTSSEDGVALPMPSSVHTLVLDEAEWRTVAAPSEAISELRTRRREPTPCDALVIESIFLDTEAAATSVVALGDGTAWIMTEDRGEAFVYDGRTVERATVSPALVWSEVERTPGGDFVASSRNPDALYRGRPSGLSLELSAVTSSVGRADTARIAVTSDDRVFVMTKRGEIFEAGATAPRFAFTHVTSTDDNALIAVGDTLYGASDFSADVVRLIDGRAPQLIHITSGSGGIELADVPGFGILVGTAHSEVFRVDEDRTVELGTLELNKSRTILPWGEFVMVGGNNGTVALLDAGGQACTIGRQTVEDLAIGARLGDAAIFLPTSRSDRINAGGPTPMTVVR